MTGESGTQRTPVAMLLLADPTMDARVIKTTRALQDAGYAVTLWCLPAQRSSAPLPDLHGATVRWVQAPRPVASFARVLRRMRMSRPATNQAPSHSAHTPSRPAAGEILRELRSFLGTLWLNVVLARAASSEPAAVVHAHDLDTLPAGVLLSRRRGAKLVYDAHELYPDMFSTSSPLYVGLWRLLEHRLITAANAVTTVNQSIARELQQRHRLATRPAVIMNCPPIQDEPAHQEPTVPSDEVRLLYHGWFYAERGLETLVRAMPHVAAQVMLYLRGSGPVRPVLQQLAEECGVAQRIHFLEPLPPDDLVAGLAGFSIGVVPYLPTSLNNYLCTPNKLFEYLMGGLAVVASDLPELRGAIEQWEAGALYTASDPRALAAAVNSLLTEPGILERARAAARRAALEHYNWEAQVQTLRTVYCSLTH